MRIGASIAASLAVTALVFPLATLSTGSAGAQGSTSSAVVTLPGYQASVWASGTATYSNPDSIFSDGQHIWVGYQNVTAKDGSDHKSSTVVEYSQTGQVMRTFAALGHCDGLRMDPTTHLVWALSDEDGNPHLTTIDPTTGATQLYQFPKTPHGGGYDDMAFTHGLAFIDASNPTLDKNGINPYPALDTITLSNGQAQLTPVLMGNATSLDITAGNNKKVTLNLIDPDSMTFDPQGDLVLDNQAGAQLVFIKHPGTSQQSVRSLMIGDQVDDTIWPRAAAGRLLISDTAANQVVSLQSSASPKGSVYTAAPNDSGVGGFVGTINLSTGFITPVAIGLSSPHGMVFVPNAM
jgi:hypothetical protein